ncbi:MAG: hypothetical protein JWM41_1779 [Gemmatimonadetes bacterium]|nr:hypothetical protein [Gemmatimonadota bacterium]
MRPPLCFSAAALLALFAAMPSGSAAAQTRVPGWLYTMNITADSGSQGHRGSMAVRYQVTAQSLRTEYVQISGNSGEARGAEGLYTIMNDADSTMTTVMPSQRLASITNPSAMFGTIRPAMPSVKRHVATSGIEDVGDGGFILGHATHHYRVTTTGAIEVTLDGQACTRDVGGVSDTWIAPDVDLDPAMKLTLGHFSAVLGSEAIAQSISDAATGLPKGLALRTISKHTEADAHGVPRTVTTTTEYVELSRAPIDVAVFRVPADYKVMDMRKLSARMPPELLDSIMSSRPSPAADALCGRHAKP